MARMSIDDLFLRDPRVRALADDLGWNKYEARGRLLDVFAVVYDRVDSGGDGSLTLREVDIAAEFTGLAAAMVRHNLAVQTRNGVRIRGSEERTRYLSTRESSGRAGGIKSGETRRNKSKVRAKVTFAETEGPLNPSVPDPVPDLVPDPASVPERDPSRAHATRPAAVSAPTTKPPEISNAVAPTPAISAAPEIKPPGFDPRSVGRVAVELWRGVSADRLAVAAELGLANVLPLPECDSPREPGAFRELRDRLREEGGKADVVATHVRAALLERARADKSIEWLAEKAFTEGGWRTARSYVLGAAKRARPGDLASTMRLMRRDDDAPPPTAEIGGKP